VWLACHLKMFFHFVNTQEKCNGVIAMDAAACVCSRGSSDLLSIVDLLFKSDFDSKTGCTS
jgi:hypothetical protein